MKLTVFPTKKCTILLTAIATSALLASCVSEGQRMVNEGASPAYGQGYDSGCESGKKASGDMFAQFHKNVQEFQHNQDYRQGWNDGHEECMNEWISMNRQQQLGIEQQRANDEHRIMESMENNNAQQYIPKMSQQEIDNINRL